MRILTDHITPGNQLNESLQITVTDQPGAGGANHVYEIEFGNTDGSDPTGHAQRKVVIGFQNGPLKENAINGISQEALLTIVIDRLRGFQSGEFKTRENAVALTHLETALLWLHKRTIDRMNRGVEGTIQK